MEKSPKLISVPLVQGSEGKGTLRLHFWNLHKIWM